MMRSWLVGAMGTMLVVVNTATADAQTHAFDRGAMRIGGNASVTSSSNPSRGATASDRQTVVTLNPLLEFFVTPGLAVGGTLSLNRAAFGGMSQSTAAIGPSVAYYFHAPGRELHPYLSAGANFGRTSFDGNAVEWSANQFGYRGAGGLVYLVAPNVGLTGELFYSYSRISGDDTPAPDVSANTFGFAAGFSVYMF